VPHEMSNAPAEENHMNESGPVVLSTADGICSITLNRPSAYNALDWDTMVALKDCVARVADSADVRVLILRGAGRSFCSGGDVAAMFSNCDDLGPFLARMIDTFHELLVVLSRLPIPTIAAVQGAVAGGGFSLAMACDFVIAARNTRFVTAYPHLGAPSDGGLTFRLFRKLGASLALETLTVNGDVNAERALSMRLVNEVTDVDSADEVARNWALRLLQLPPVALSEIKQLVAVQAHAGLEEHLARERAAFLRCAQTNEFKQRVERFARGNKKASA
jgi:2-(1,2-epoxy-1,2-dihydrophenyl)acetyl-CoA isomerase